jgi:SAM-dependent methyltransferase
MELKELQENWDGLGRIDPLWAILTDPGRKGGKWDPDEFFASGRQEVAQTMRLARTLGLPVRRETALDFGCGVGRLTQALCSWFERCCGVDIAPSMIELARGYNKYGGRCEYLLNTYDDLRGFTDDSFDLVYSNIVLQHMKPKYGMSYIREFVRVLRPGGLVVFQIPDGPRTAQFLAAAACGPMPDRGFRAKLTGYPAALHAVGGSQVSVPVTIQNVGECAWPSRGDREQKYVVKLGNHWLTPGGKTVVRDDGRQPLPYDLPQNAVIRTAITVTAPLSAGNYILELDMVQEAVAWFKHKSSSTAWVQAEIEPAPMRVAAMAADSPPRMEMYGIEKDNVIEVLKSEGARVLDTREDGFAGPDWISYQYFATKS